MDGRSIAILESLGVAAILPAADVLLQAIMAAGFNAIDLKQVGAAAAVGGLTYLIGFLRGLPLAPNGEPLPPPPADPQPHG